MTNPTKLQEALDELGISELVCQPEQPKFNLNTPRFVEVVTNLVSRYKIRKIVETGTFNGKGTTSVYAQTGIPVVTCEVAPDHWRAAKTVLNSFSNVQSDLAWSVERMNAPDHLLKKIGFELPTAEFWLLRNLMAALLESKSSILISLDSGSAERIGMAEIKTLVSFWEVWKEHSPEPLVLICDDIDNHKHQKSVFFLADRGIKIHQVENRWGFAILRG